MSGREQALALLNRLIDRAERNPGGGRLIRERLPVGALLSEEREARDTMLGAAQAAGAVRLVAGRKERAHELEWVELIDAAPLYPLLRRVPAGDRAVMAAALVRQRLELPPQWAEVLAALEQGWRTGRRPAGIGAEDAADLAHAFAVALALAEGRWASFDMRTVSAKVTGNSKWLETHRAPVAWLLEAVGAVPTGLSAEEAITFLGVAKFPHPYLLAGPLAIDRTALPARPYVGIAPDNLPRLALTTEPAYILTIENFASFNRHVRELPGDEAVVLYTAGFSSPAFLDAYIRLAAACSAPLYHWGDIDPAGLWIAEQLARRAPRPLRLHLMTPELATGRGTSAPPAVLAGQWSCEDIAALAAFLASDKAHRLEQEAVDPAVPDEIATNERLGSLSHS